MANYSIEIERNNVTLAQFLRYVRQQCEKKGIYMEIDRDEFEKPSRPESYSYTVIDGEKKCHSASYRTMTNLRRKLASYKTVKGYTRFYYTDEFEEYEAEKEARSARAIAVARALEQAYLSAQIGTTQEVLWEEPAGEGLYTGHTPTYTKVYAPGDGLHNQICNVTITGLYKDGLLGQF